MNKIGVKSEQVQKPNSYVFSQDEADLTETESLCTALNKEMRAMRPWYDLSVENGAGRLWA